LAGPVEAPKNWDGFPRMAWQNNQKKRGLTYGLVKFHMLLKSQGEAGMCYSGEFLEGTGEGGGRGKGELHQKRGGKSRGGVRIVPTEGRGGQTGKTGLSGISQSTTKR